MTPSQDELKLVALLTTMESKMDNMCSAITTSYNKILEENTKTIRDQAANYKQLVYALIASVGATVGVKFLGSPPWTELVEYITLFAGLFTILNLIFTWQSIATLWKKIFLIVLASFMMFSATSHLWLRNEEGHLPTWFNPTINGFFIVLAVFAIWGMWKHKWK